MSATLFYPSNEDFLYEEQFFSDTGSRTLLEIPITNQDYTDLYVKIQTDINGALNVQADLYFNGENTGGAYNDTYFGGINGTTTVSGSNLASNTMKGVYLGRNVATYPVNNIVEIYIKDYYQSQLFKSVEYACKYYYDTGVSKYAEGKGIGTYLTSLANIEMIDLLVSGVTFNQVYVKLFHIGKR